MLGMELFANHCSKNLLPGFPNWNKGLDFKHDGSGGCVLDGFKLNDVWIVVANLVQMALFLAGLLAVVFIIIGGIMFITSSGNPDNVARARKTLTSALLGLIVAVLASTIIGYVASLFG